MGSLPSSAHLLFLGLCLHLGWAALCPYGGWQSYGNSCYYFYNANYTRTWSDARQRCLEQDADLVTLETSGERDWVLGQVRQRMAYSHNTHSNWWTGLHVRPDHSGNAWAWPNSSAAVNINIFQGKWAAGQPRKDGSHQCVEIQSLKFTVARCSDSYQAICERPAGRPLTCDPGWTLFGGQCYRFFGSAQSFTGARGMCHRSGATLPQVYDSSTQTIVWDLARTKGQNLWLSLQSLQQGRSYGWRWDNGTMLSHPTYWYRNPPSSLGSNVNRTCVEQLQNQGVTRSWNAIPCSSSRQFYCQKPEGSCPNGWLQLTNRCFFIYTHDPKPFSAALAYCNGLGASLAALDSADVTSFLYPYVHNARAAGAQTLWIGLTDYNQDSGQWKWVSGNQTLGRWHNWPNNRATNTRGKQDCVSIDSNDRNLRWHPSPTCGSAHRFICQLPVNKAIKRPTIPPVHYRCPRGYVMYAPLKTCIQLVSRDMTWDQASSDCQARGASLVTIPNTAFNNFIKAQMRTHRGKYWIGLHDRHHENTFQWLSSNAQATFTDWSGGQPNSQGSTANCVSMFDQGSYKWYEMPCTNRYHYICQVAASDSPPSSSGCCRGDRVSVEWRGVEWSCVEPCTNHYHYISVNGQVPPVTTPKPWSPNCGPYWEAAPNSYSCYMFSTERLSWMDARSACQASHGDLVSITSLSEEAYVTGRIASLNSNFFWVGANDRQVETGWRWSDSSAMAFLNWKPGEPNNQGNSDCVGISKMDGRWSDFTCTSRYGYICEKMGRNTPRPTPAQTSPASTPRGKVWGCPRGWEGFSGQCYVFLWVHSVDWQTAYSRCTQYGSAMVSIHSDAENKFVFSLLPQGFNSVVWIGLNDQSQEGSFRWTDSSPVTFTQWNNHEPNNINNEDCVVMYRNGKWTDYKCTARNVDGLVCKRPMSLQNAQDQLLAQGCPFGIGFRAQCYAYITATKTWQDAQSDCRRHHGNLATVNDRHIQAFVASELVYRPGVAYWIGLKNSGGQNTSYTWATNYGVDFTSWSELHTGNERGTCVGMGTGRPVGLWSNYPCSKRLPYICEVPRQGFTTPPPTPPTTTSRIHCPRGWKGYQSVCIKAFNLTQEHRLSWMESRSFCQSLGGDLLSLWSKSMEDSVISRVFLNITTDNIWWIGLNDRASEYGHVWSDGHGVAYTKWSPGEPNDYNNREDCVEWVFPKNSWNDDNCYMARNFVCSIPRGTILATTLPPPTGVTGSMCQNGSWLYYGGQCYFFSPQEGDTARLTWYQARRVCLGMGADLVSVHSADENGFLTSTMSRHSAWVFWTGLNDLDHNGYSWTNGEAVNFVSWRVNEPNDAFGEESCVESLSTGEWNDNNCQDNNAYICKRPLNGYVTQQTTIPPVYGGCPPGYTSLPFLPRCYKVAGLTDDTRKNFTDAITACSQMMPPASLASIHSYLEQTYVMTLTAKLPHYAWIGLNDRKRRNYFEWHDNSEVDYTHWGSGQPDENLHSNNPDDRRDCVGMNPQPRYAGNWNDMQCRNRNHYICQVSKVPNGQTLPPRVSGCPAGYSKHLDTCYKFHPTGATWSSAEAICRGERGLLAAFSDRFQLNVVSLIRRSQGPQQHVWQPADIWIGLSVHEDSKRYQWLNGWPLRFSKWGQGEPSTNGSCVKMGPKNFWYTQPCSTKYPFVCQISNGPPPTSTTVSGACPDSTWRPYGEHCYQLLPSTRRSWPEAGYACSVQGAGLASVHSQKEMLFLASLFSSAVRQGADSNGNVWIGLSKGFSRGFSWADGTEVEYDNWDDGEPSDTDRGQHQDCVQASLLSGKWNDVDCFDTNYFVCKTLQQATTTPFSGTTLAFATQQPGAVTVTPRPVTPWGPVVTQPHQNPVTPRPHTQNPVTPRPHTQRPQGPTAGPLGPGMFTHRQTAGGNTPQPQTGGGGGGGSGLSGGGVAGIVLGTAAIIAIAVVAVVFLHGRFNLQLLRGPLGSAGGGGFDNALYSKGSGDEGKGGVSFGSNAGCTES